MTNRDAIHELVLLLRESCALASEADPVRAAAILRQAMRTLHETEDREAREAERGREAMREVRTGLRSLELKSTNAVAVEVEHGVEVERARATRSLKAEKALKKAKAAS